MIVCLNNVMRAEVLIRKSKINYFVPRVTHYKSKVISTSTLYTPCMYPYYIILTFLPVCMYILYVSRIML